MRPAEAKIAYVPKGYPRVSETFISNEILALERLGLDIEIYALKRPEGAERQPSTRQVRAPVTYVPERVLRALPRMLPVHLLLCLRRPRSYARALGWCLSHCLRERSTTTLRRFLQAGWLVGWVLRGRRIAHFHAHFCHGPATVVMFVKWLTGSTYSFTAHAKDLYLTRPTLLREKMREAKFVVTCTEHNRRRLEEVGGGLTPVRRIYHGVDLQRFAPAGGATGAREARTGPVHGARSRLGQSSPLVLSVGRLVEKKGFETLIRACGVLRERGLGFHCRIYGDGPLRRALLELVRELGLEGMVELPGTILQDDLAAEYGRADIFALPCKVLPNGDRDGLPNVLVEAQACGLPVVSTRVSGIPELIEDGVNGLLAPPGDPAALAAHLSTLLLDAGLRRRLGEAGRLKVRAGFVLEDNARALFDLFQHALDQPLERPRDRALDLANDRQVDRPLDRPLAPEVGRPIAPPRRQAVR